MNKLLSAGFSRLWKDKIFWLSTVLIFAVSVGSMLNGCRQAANWDEIDSAPVLDGYFFELAPMIGLFIAIFAALFFGTEYSDGTIRNKLAVGHTRTNIHLANFVTCFAAGICFLAAWMLGGLVGIPFLGTLQLGAEGFLIFLSIAILFTAALAGIFTLLSTVSTNKAMTAVLVILLYLGLLIAASTSYNSLCEPETISGVEMTMEGMKVHDPAPNPYYVSGALRTFLEWVVDFLPTGQGILMANVEIAHPVRNVICSVAIVLVTTVSGIFMFRKKDLK